ncbi:hypothetical protein TI39_contig329g00021 [Zymoseptoria brevis]|uniref:Uncharacterized protein n=1 Tax=Zymoseptoria brevis TaxID=1047168 RepID=A0A0F4GT97_9PEZI|nr:hypothetical protein TI39_contig329g00021 [Zymoseptoria brevis]
MAGSKPQQFARPPPKKKPPKAASLITPDDFQSSADFEESAGGKHRVGDAQKSARAFIRALDIYDRGLAKHPSSFDLAYNKARLQLEISQQPVLVELIGVELLQWLESTLASHRRALQLSVENVDVLFNTAQVLTSLAEVLVEDGEDEGDEEEEAKASRALQEALELLSVCLSRQEVLFEQHRADFPDVEEGGVALDAQEGGVALDAQEGAAESSTPAAPPAAQEDDTDMAEATIETPISPSDLLDTVHASLSALTTLLPLSDHSALQNLGEMARALTEDKAPTYIRLLDSTAQAPATLSLALDRAVFIAAYANAEFEARQLHFSTYLSRLDESFRIPGKESDASLLCAEADARMEMVLSALDVFGQGAPNFPVHTCWKTLSLSQELYTLASKLETEDAKERKADVFKSKGDVELLRLRLTQMAGTDLSASVRSSGPTLVKNAQTFYKGAVSQAKASGDEEVEEEAKGRWIVAGEVSRVVFGGQGSGAGEKSGEDLMEVLEGCVEEGIVGRDVAGRIVNGEVGGGSSSRA